MFLRKRKKLVSRVLLIVLLIEGLSPFFSEKAHAGSPVSDKLSGLVDPFTGDFHYNIPCKSSDKSGLKGSKNVRSKFLI